jgi:hypothetical protein
VNDNHFERDKINKNLFFNQAISMLNFY